MNAADDPLTYLDRAHDRPPYQWDREGALLRTNLPWPVRRGKVRDVYDLGDRLMIVSTDRISAFDFVLPSGIPEKGKLLTAMSRYWFDQIDRGEITGPDDQPIAHHLLSVDVPESVAAQVDPEPLRGRLMVTVKADVIPFECVVRGYLEGSGWREYQSTGQVCGIPLPAGLRQCDPLASAIFTPATKADEGHDENVSLAQMANVLGDELTHRLRDLSLSIYNGASRIAQSKGLLIADTKFEFGHVAGRLVLIDEVLTPDSSRFWSIEDYQPGQSQRSFDKQFVREYLYGSNWDRVSPPPPLPIEIVQQTALKYHEAYQRLTTI